MPDPAADQATARPARREEFALLPAVEFAADSLFAAAGIAPLPPPAAVSQFPDAAAVFVVGDPPVGFARLDLVDGTAHLEQLSVQPDHGRRGLGAVLLAAACQWAVGESHPAVTLCTFAEVPWNAPFYARHGFVSLAEHELTPGLRELRRHEAELGLDALGRRTVMRRTLSGPRN